MAAAEGENVTGSAEDAELADILDSAETVPPPSPADPGDVVDAEIVDDPNVVDIHEPRDERRSRREKANSRPPLVDEWQKWFADVLIRAGTDWYLSMAFADIDDEQVSERDLAQLRLSDEERNRIAKPFAELANKLKVTRKYGRTIVATTGTFESLLTLGQWVSRVRRISLKYRARSGSASHSESVTVQGKVVPPNGDTGSGPPASNGHVREGDHIGLFNPGTG